MDKMEDIVVVLNELLNIEEFDNELLERSVNQFNKLCKSKSVSDDNLPDSLDPIY